MKYLEEKKEEVKANWSLGLKIGVALIVVAVIEVVLGAQGGSFAFLIFGVALYIWIRDESRKQREKKFLKKDSDDNLPVVEHTVPEVEIKEEPSKFAKWAGKHPWTLTLIILGFIAAIIIAHFFLDH